MPAKLQVEESFAFLFTCIEVSGTKLDFNQIGEVAGLTPAAARMRYSRLRKAVESGEFHGAYIHQPQGASAQMVGLVNPGGRQDKKAGGAASKSVSGSSVYASTRKSSKRPKKSKKDESDEEKEEITTAPTRKGSRKRKAEHFSDDDEPEFFLPKGSTASIKHARIKADSLDDEEEEEEPEDFNDDEELDDSFVSKTTRSTSSKVSKNLPKLILRTRGKDPVSLSVPKRSASLASKKARAASPQFSYFIPPVDPDETEEEELEEEYEEEEEEIQKMRKLPQRTEATQLMNSHAFQYRGETSGSRVAPKSQPAGKFVRNTPSNIITGDGASDVIAEQVFPPSIQSTRQTRSVRATTRRYGARVNGNRNRNDDNVENNEQQIAGDNQSRNLHIANEPFNIPKSSTLPPSGFFSPPKVRNKSTSDPNLIQGDTAQCNNTRAVRSMPPPPLPPTRDTNRSLYDTVPPTTVDRSHFSSILQGVNGPQQRSFQHLYSGPANPAGASYFTLPHTQSTHSALMGTNTAMQNGSPDPRLRGPGSSSFLHPLPPSIILPVSARPGSYTPTAARGTAQPVRRPSPLSTSLRRSVYANDNAAAHTTDEVQDEVMLSIERDDTQAVQAGPSTKTVKDNNNASASVLAPSSGHTAEEMEAALTLVGLRQGQGEIATGNGALPVEHQDVEAAEILLAMQRGQDGDETEEEA